MIAIVLSIKLSREAFFSVFALYHRYFYTESQGVWRL